MYFLGLLMIIYYFIIVILNGFGTSFSLFWLIFGIFFALSYFYRKQKIYRILNYITKIIICIFCVFQIFLVYYMNTETVDNADYVIVLGAKVNGTIPSDALMSRIEKCADYMQTHKNSIAIASGGKGLNEDISEAEAIKKELINKGIEENRILTENKSRTNVENIKYSAKLISKYKKVAVITSDYHIFRALIICKSYGINAVGGIGVSSNKYMFIHNATREFLTFCIDLFKGNIKVYFS